MFPTVHKVIANGLRVAYRRAGVGPPLLLLHGGPGHSGEWRHELDGLSDGLAVVAPGHAWLGGLGRSARPLAHARLRRLSGGVLARTRLEPPSGGNSIICSIRWRRCSAAAAPSEPAQPA